MFQRQAYVNSLKEILGGLIKELELNDLQKDFLRSRWLDRVLWMEARANRAQALDYILRLTTIVGGVIVPALVIAEVRYERVTLITWVMVGVSLLVAISAILSVFLRYGEQWRHYRMNVELLKSEGWLFFQLSGRRYRRFGSHAEAYPRFAGRVEKLHQLGVEDYITEVVEEKTEGEE